MALALTITLSPAVPFPGQPVTATYIVSGEPVPPPDATLAGAATIDGLDLAATSTVHFANVEKFKAPTLAGYVFAATADPKVWAGTPA